MQSMEMTVHVKDGGCLHHRYPDPSISSCPPKGYGYHLLVHGWPGYGLYWPVVAFIGGDNA